MDSQTHMHNGKKVLIVQQTLLKVTPNRRFYISFIFLNFFDSNSVFGVLETASGPAGVRVELGGL